MSDRDGYLRELGGELRRVGFRGARRSRILDEFSDHLDCDPGADLGDPRGLAEQFADELGTSFARTSAVVAFAALALAGVLLVVRLLRMGPFNQISGSAPDTLGLLTAVMAAQIAFVAGTLGMIRALRLRQRRAIEAGEAKILSRRAGVGLAAGALATIAIPLRAAASHGQSGSAWWSAATVVVALVAIAAASLIVVRAVRLRPVRQGAGEDVLADFGPIRPVADALTGASPTRLALLIAGALALVIALAGVVADDPYDGILRGLTEAVVFLGTYAVLGRYLGLRSASAAPRVE